MVCGYLLVQRQIVIRSRGLPPLVDGMEVYDLAGNATVICEHLAKLPDPAGPDGMALLTRVVEAIPRPGRANINRIDRILPARLAMVDHTWEGWSSKSAASQIPLFCRKGLSYRPVSPFLGRLNRPECGAGSGEYGAGPQG